MGNALHQAAITQKNPGLVVDYSVIGLVELITEYFFCERHSHGVCNALAKGAGGSLHPGCVAILRVSSCLGVKLSKVP